MFHYAALCFAITIVASFVGFGDVPGSVPLTKAFAVVFLLLFCVSLLRWLYASEAAPTRDAGARAPEAARNP